jgi:hypothetical protein
MITDSYAGQHLVLMMILCLIHMVIPALVGMMLIHQGVTIITTMTSNLQRAVAPVEVEIKEQRALLQEPIAIVTLMPKTHTVTAVVIMTIFQALVDHMMEVLTETTIRISRQQLPAVHAEEEQDQLTILARMNA